MFDLSSNGHSRGFSFASITLSSPSARHRNSSSSYSRSDPSSLGPQARNSTPGKRRSLAVTRDLFAGGSRDAVRCKPGGLDGLEELLAMDPPPLPRTRRASEQLPAMQPSTPAYRRTSLPTHSLAWPVTAPTPLVVSASPPVAPSTALSPYTLPTRSSATGAVDSGATRTTRAAPRPKPVRRKPVPALALGDEVETVTDPRWDGSVCVSSVGHQPMAKQANRDDSSDDELVILERVRKMSVEDGGLGIALPGSSQPLEPSGIPAASFPLPPLTSPISSVYTSTSAASSALSRTTTSAASTNSSASSVPSSTASSSTRLFALVKKRHAKSTTAHNVIFSSNLQRCGQREEDLLDAWMDVIVGDDAAPSDALPFGRSKRPAHMYWPSGSSLTAASLASISSVSAPTPRPPPASFASVVSFSAPSELAPDAVATLANSVPPLVYASSAASSSSVDAPTGLSTFDDDDMDTGSDDTHSACDTFYDAEEELEGIVSSSEAPAPVAQPSTRKRSISEIASPPSSLASSLPSPTSPARSQPKRRFLSLSSSTDNPLPPRPPRSARRTSLRVVSAFGAGSSLSAVVSSRSGEFSHAQEQRMHTQVTVA